MTQTHDYIPSGFCDALARYLAERQIQAPDLAEKLAALGQSPAITASQFGELLESIYQLEPVPALGLRIGRGVKPQNFGVVGYLVLSCSSLGQALIRYRRFQQLLQTGLTSQVTQQGSLLRIHWTLPIANTPLAYEFSLAAFVSLYQALLGKNITPHHAGLPIKKPKDSHIHEGILGCPISFDAESLFVEIPARLMAMRISTSDTYLRNLFEQQALAMLEQQSELTLGIEEFSEKLQQHLINALQTGDASADTIAKQMGYSLRSFYRKLNQSGHSFRSILADTRLRLAKHYLADPALSHLEVALLLGYAEQSSFIRAFKSWMGITPRDYRNKIERNKIKGNKIEGTKVESNKLANTNNKRRAEN